MTSSFQTSIFDRLIFGTCFLVIADKGGRG